ncbi:MAG: hypothetical protein R3362_10575, partial [Rhodothermales bacterium]|nr:hypothetical protein [Rhodothermales bacterium]
MPTLRALLSALDTRRAAFLAALGHLPEAQRQQRPKPEAWSPLMIGEHLMLVERGMGVITERQVA